MNESNPIADLAELRYSAPDDAPLDELFYQLRFGEIALILEDQRMVTIALKKAFLALDMVGVDVKPGSEYGNDVKNVPLTINHSSEKTTGFTSGGRCEISTSKQPDVSIAAAGKISKATKETTTFERQKSPVIARAGQKWEFVDPEDKTLDGVYLQHDAALCKLRAMKGANQKEVTARILVRQRDMIFTWTETGKLAVYRLSRNKEALLNIMIGEALRARGAKVHNIALGGIVLSEVVTDHEGI